MDVHKYGITVMLSAAMNT